MEINQKWELTKGGNYSKIVITNFLSNRDICYDNIIVGKSHNYKLIIYNRWNFLAN